jgi:hypothetical protein
MPGYQEILIISAIVLGVIFIPRMMEQKKRPTLRLVRPRKVISGRWRMAIAVSIVYPLVVAGLMQPWRNDPFTFGYIGLGPVILGWLLFWVVQGFRRR